MEASVARKAQNEAIFRDANEEIEAVREELTAIEGKTPFLCECEDPECREVVRLDVAAYEAVRANATHFLLAPGHPATTGHVIEEHPGYVVVEKDAPVARRIAIDTDPRRDDG